MIDSPLPPVYSDPALETPAIPYPSLLPDSTYGFVDVCTGASYAGAEPYGGAAPHRAVIDISSKGPEADDYLGDLSE
ncbi:hypothetical protein [Cryptosporangium sp. NPDC048952]|uniref:hypothetical protein n=1 Tax=Cryptosporangium sp. NPDC048952 TaxID=3363961 RepID=UPI0037191DDC